MKKAVALLLVLTLTTSCLVTILPAATAAQRTINVPGNYSTISDAITHALEGDTILVKKGTYEYPVNQTLTIQKTLTLKGEGAQINLHPPWVSNIIFTQDFSGYAPPVKIEAGNVRLSGFTFWTDEKGMLYSNGNGTQIAGNNFVNFEGVSVTGDNCTIVDNNVSGSIQLNGNWGKITRNAFSATLLCYGSFNFVAENKPNRPDIGGQTLAIRGSYNEIVGNHILGPAWSGLALMQIYGDHNMVFENTVDFVMNANTATGDPQFPYRLELGVDISSSESIFAKNNITNCSSGIRVGGGFQTNTSNTVIFGNNITGANWIWTYGIQIVGFNEEAGTGAANNIIFGNYIAYFEKGLESSGYNNTLFLNSFVNNTQHSRCEYFGEPNYSPDNFDNGKEGNYYDDYAGKDADNDGYGDIPYYVPAVLYKFNETRGISETVNFTIEDDYPIVKRFNISTATLTLPKWTSSLPLTIRSSAFVNKTEYLTGISTGGSSLEFDYQKAVLVVSVAAAAGVVAAVLIYFKKHKHQIIPTSTISNNN